MGGYGAKNHSPLIQIVGGYWNFGGGYYCSHASHSHPVAPERKKAAEEFNTTSKSPAKGEIVERSATLDQKSSSPPDTTVKDLVRAWNQGRTNEIAKMFASDGVLIIPAGSQIQSSAEIEKTIQERRAGILKDTTLSNTVENVSQSDENRATVKGTYQLEGIKILGISKSASGSYILHQVRQQGRWLISRAELIKGDQD